MSHKAGIYEKYIKRILDFILSLMALIVLSPILLILVIIGAAKMKGNPFFTQMRPGKDEKIFKLIKFRTMTNEKDDEGNLLPDDVRLTRYGRFLRSTSLDELPELINILKGDMSIVGPRPLLVRDMVFMTPDQRFRHSVRQGLTGLAQISGRNNLSWERKFELDIRYINRGITIVHDLKIIVITVFNVFKKKDVVRDGFVTDIDYGDWLLQNGYIEYSSYHENRALAKKIIKGTIK